MLDKEEQTSSSITSRDGTSVEVGQGKPDADSRFEKRTLLVTQSTYFTRMLMFRV